MSPIRITGMPASSRRRQLSAERFGKLDVIVNNAGVMPLSPLDALKVDEWEQMVDVNIKGVLYGIAAPLPVFAQQGHGP